MFETLRMRFQDMRTVGALCTAAEKYAHAAAQEEPGAEHFMLAAFDLPDRTAIKTFERLQVNPDRFQSAIEQQYQNALSSLGIEIKTHPVFTQPASIAPRAKIYQAKPSGQELLKNLAGQKGFRSAQPLLGAHILLAAVTAQYGTVIRALQVLGISADTLAAAAKEEIEAFYKG